MKKLDYVGFVEPRLINRLPVQAQVESGRLEVGGMNFWFTGEPYPDGTQVEIRISNRNFVAESLEEQTIRYEVARAAEAMDKRREEAKRKQAIAEAKKFNASLSIPVEWGGVIKTVLSGLGANSWDDGENRSTVIHIEVHEPLESGRLKRKAGELLCGAGDSRMYNAEASAFGSHARKVSCKACLKVAERWQV